MLFIVWRVFVLLCVASCVWFVVVCLIVFVVRCCVLLCIVVCWLFLAPSASCCSLREVCCSLCIVGRLVFRVVAFNGWRLFFVVCCALCVVCSLAFVGCCLLCVVC